MRIKQVRPAHLRQDKKYRLYSPTALNNAYLSVLNKEMSQRRASIQFNVPRQTLRDRITGRVDPECVTTGRAPVFTLEEEEKIVDHVKTMASYGYGYTRQEVTDLATDFAHTIENKSDNEALTLRWFEGLMNRWPELKVTKPRSLEIQRAKCGSIENVEKYFASLKDIIKKYKLEDKPHLIFNVDEKGITINHKPPNIVSGTECKVSAVTSGRSSTTTILGCGNASGFALPPFFVFEGKRMIKDLMNGASPGADSTVSETGWSNTKVFKQYLSDHFLKFVPGRNNEPILLLLDGHKSHVAIDIIEWAQEYNIILHVLPAHTSHILQPLDVGCYGPFQRIYDNECHKTIRQSHSVITRYNICELSCKAYQRALSPENLQSSFRKTGIYPLSIDVINRDLLKPSEIFQTTRRTDDNNVLTGVDMEVDQTETENINMLVVEDTQETQAPQFFTERVNKLKEIKSEINKKERNTLGKIVSGMAITEKEVTAKVKQHIEKQGKTTGKTSKKGKQLPSTSGKQKEPKPGPSHIYINDSMDMTDEDTDDEEIPEEEKCCVCKQFTPKEIRQGVGLELTKWVQCSNEACKHWTHLKYCTVLRVVRRDTRFFCIHCKDME